MDASFRGHEGVVRLLLARGAKVVTRTKHGITALSLAASACASLLRAHVAKR